MIKTKGFLLLFLLFSSFVAQANSQFSETTIEAFIVHDYGTEIIITLPGNVSNGEGCTNNFQLVLTTSHPLFDQMFSVLLSAFHADTSFYGWVNGCHAMGMPILTRIDLQK